MAENLVIIPTYNEYDNVRPIVDQILALTEDFDILFVDDGSPDGTADEIRQQMERYIDRIYLIEREGKLGLGTAYIAGFRWALERNYQHIIEMDCDFSHPVSALPRLISTVRNEDVDVCVGSRYVKGGNVEDWPIGRLLMSYMASLYVRVLTWLPVKDTTAGFVCYTQEALSAIDLDSIHFKGYGFQIEMKYAVYRLGYKIKEIPITFVDRKVGISKMSSSIFGEAFTGVIKLRWWSIIGKFPLGRKKIRRKK